MASNYWIKLYIEILQDRKMARLPDNIWRLCIELFLLAGEINKDGELPSTEDIAWELRRNDVTELETMLLQIVTLGIIEQTETGWLVINYAKRQAASPAKERMRQYRERKKRQKLRISDSDDTQRLQNVTGKLRNVTPDTDTDTDTDDNDDNGVFDEKALQAIVANYEDIISVQYSSTMADEFKKYAAQVRPEWVANAFKVAEAQNVRKWSYVRAILNSCIDAGGWVDKRNENGQGAVSKTYLGNGGSIG